MMKSVALLEEFVNLPEMLGRVENDRELLVELFALFQEELPASREALQSAIRADDLPETANTAHRFKGMLANLSAHGNYCRHLSPRAALFLRHCRRF